MPDELIPKSDRTRRRAWSEPLSLDAEVEALHSPGKLSRAHAEPLITGSICEDQQIRHPPLNDLEIEEFEESSNGDHNSSSPITKVSLQQQKLELEQLKLQLKEAKMKRDFLKSQLFSQRGRQLGVVEHSDGKDDNKERELRSDLERLSTLRREEEAGKRLITLLIHCQSINGVGPSKQISESKLKRVVDLLNDNERLDMSYTDSFGRSGLHLLCSISPSKLSLMAMRKLIDKGHDVEGRTQYGKTCVHICAETPNVGALKLLLRWRADVTARSRSSLSPSALEIAMCGLKYSSGEAKANCHVYAEMVSSLAYWSIMQGDIMSVEMTEKYGTNASINRALKLGREKAVKGFRKARRHLSRKLKVIALVDMVMKYVGLSIEFHPLPSFPRNSQRLSLSSVPRNTQRLSQSRRLQRTQTMPQKSKFR